MSVSDATVDKAYDGLAAFGRFEIVLGAVGAVVIALLIVCIGVFMAPKKTMLAFVGIGLVIGGAAIGMADYALKSKRFSALEGGVGLFQTMFMLV
jgi:hypothetical protein